MLTTLSITEFCYWLQGAIEIGNLKEIDCSKANIIYGKLALLDKHNYFTIAVKTILEHYPLETGFPAISAELQNMFKHDIDPSYEGDQDFFYAVHQGEAVSKHD